jgi:flagellar biogenesis protein FliO
MKITKIQNSNSRDISRLRPRSTAIRCTWSLRLEPSLSVECWILKLLLIAVLGVSCANICSAETVAGSPLLSPSLPDTTPSIIRVLGALALVIGLFLAGVWGFRNWQRFAVRGKGPRLNVLEVRSLGGRQALYVVGYEEQRFLLAAAPTGISLLTHLPPAEAVALDQAPDARKSATPILSFPQALAQVLRGQTARSGQPG